MTADGQEEPVADDAPTATSKLQFHYIKSGSYRDFACHGALGGPTPQGKIWVGFYSERPPIPRVVEFDLPLPKAEETIEFDESAAQPSNIETRHGLVRNVEVGMFIDLETAERVHTWLGEHIARMKPSSR